MYPRSLVQVRKYYALSGQRIAMRRDHILFFLATDHLGTTSVVLDAAGNKLDESRHYPYGTERWPVDGTFPTEYRFTGQLLDAPLGLYHMGARWYDPALGRWTSPDVVVPDPANPQSLNRCSWVVGNPLRYADPSGHMETECGQDGQECESEDSPLSWETVADLLADTAEWINAPNRTKPIVLDVGGVSLVIMPIGADPLESRPDAFRAIGAGLTEVGKYVDLIELMLIPSGAQDPLGAIDVAVAAASDLFSGDMWLFGQPDETLPPMFLIGQDVLWTAGLDFAVPWGVGVSAGVVTADPAIGLAAKQMTDLCTTFASAIYDWSRADGARTVLNAGVSFQQPGLEGYVLFYP